MIKKFLLFAFAAIFFLNTDSGAEDCSAIGCTGSVGYVFMSEAQYLNNQPEISLNGIRYKVNDTNRIFKVKGLPDVNTVVTVNTSYYELFGVYDIKDDLKNISKKLLSWKDMEFDDNNKTVSLNIFQGNIGNRLSEGTKLQILGYRMLKEFIPEIYFNHLAVLVKVVSEPDDNTDKASTKDSSPSFDCTKAMTKTEKLICSDKNLSEADKQLNILYKNIIEKIKDKEALKKDQLTWTKNIRNKCNDSSCMMSAYESRIRILKEMDITAK